MKVEIIKNCQDGARTRLKGQVLTVTSWKAEELVKRKLAKVLFKNTVKVPIEEVETAEKKEVKKETR